MEKKYYSDERGVQIVLSILKANGIKKIVASPGSTNLCFVGSVQNDPFFEVYSSVDERSAAYIACGMAAESGEPVVLSCTGATASRNYYSGLTEAYYRKLPILAVTSHQGTDRIGQLVAQNIDRRNLPNDIVKLSVEVPFIHDARDEHFAEIEVNRAVRELYRRGGGPAHINLHTRYSTNFSVKELPDCRIIRYYGVNDKLPELPKGGIAVVVGSHRTFTVEENDAIEKFCAEKNAVVFCDHSSGYYGKYRVQAQALLSQKSYDSPFNHFSMFIHIGEMTGDYTLGAIRAKEVWRVNPDGETRDPFNRLTSVFEMEESHFFSAYTKDGEKRDGSHIIDSFRTDIENVRQNIPELELSNIWIAQQTAPNIPAGSRVHLGILNTLRTWNFFEFPNTVETSSNVGGFGIDGIMSSLIGASLVDSSRLYFAVLGDLSFFYDMNVIGNRHVGNNVRILMINNGRGAEFRLKGQPCATFGEDTDLYMAAAGHFGNQSPNLVRHFAEELGYEYLTASSKSEYLKVRERFLTPEITEKPMILEVFTNYNNESEMLTAAGTAIVDSNAETKKKVVNAIKGVVGQGGIETIKKILGK